VRLLAAASVRHLLRHPAQGALALLGLALGVATIVAVDIATASARRAFELSLRAVNGTATHQIAGGPGGIDEQLYVQLRTGVPAAAESQWVLAPLVAGYATSHERTLQLIGIDPFASAELEGGAGVLAAAASGDAVAAARSWFTAPGAVLMSAATARALGLTRGASFELEVAGVRHAAELIGTLEGERPGLDDVILTDIAQAQEWLHELGRLSRIDVRLPAGAGGATLAQALRARLPPALELTATRAEARETLDMTAAFTTNLKAMSLLALLVGTFLIYGAMSFAVVQRRALIGVLRALGATRAEVLRLVLGEAALLGLGGALAGALLGLFLARALVGLVSQTINDLYFVVAVRAVAVPWGTLGAALALGVATALAAALVPALEAARGAPRLALTRSVLEHRSRSLALSLALLGAALAFAAALTVAFSGRSLFAGFAALFMLLLSVAAVAPAALRLLARALAQAFAGRSAALRLALTEVAGSLSRTGVAVAALGMALAAMIGVAIMVQSFRASLEEWLLATLRADIYVSAPGPSGSAERRLDPALIPALLQVAGVRAHSEGRRVEVASARGTLELAAVRLTSEGRSGYRFTQGDPARAWPQFSAGAILISEPLAWRLQLAPHERLALRTVQGFRSFAVAGVYREYGNDHGEVLMDLAQYRQYFDDDAISALGLYLSPGAQADAVIERVRAAARGRQTLFIRSNAELRALSMRIFERTFLITRVLYWLAAGVAAVGLLSALLAWELERLRPLAILRSLGLTPWGSAALITAQTLFMGVAAFLAAIPAGLLTALVLTEVINRRAFGWQIDLHLDAAQFGAAFALALGAAALAALYPAWRSARGALAPYLREE
jgi:putative ABC transport system permease protein